MSSTYNPWMWGSFAFIITIILSIDLFLLGRKKTHTITTREASLWLSFLILSALLFGMIMGIVWYWNHGQAIALKKTTEFLTGYLIEFTLSMDNMFLFYTIFQHFLIPQQFQHRVLLYGVFSALILRCIMILGGIWIINRFHWILYLFGFLLLFTGYRMLFIKKEHETLEEHILLKFLNRYIRITHTLNDESFFIKLNKLWYATPLFVALVFIEFSDIVFALDSIPAIFAVTNDVFIIVTSNIFAVLGLRTLYFLLSNTTARYPIFKMGIALMLLAIGFKMLANYFISIPIIVTFLIIVLILGGTFLTILIQKFHKRRSS